MSIKPLIIFDRSAQASGPWSALTSIAKLAGDMLTRRMTRRASG
jgi:hypothetical protein